MNLPSIWKFFFLTFKNIYLLQMHMCMHPEMCMGTWVPWYMCGGRGQLPRAVSLFSLSGSQGWNSADKVDDKSLSPLKFIPVSFLVCYLLEYKSYDVKGLSSLRVSLMLKCSNDGKCWFLEWADKWESTSIGEKLTKLMKHEWSVEGEKSSPEFH